MAVNISDRLGGAPARVVESDDRDGLLVDAEASRRLLGGRWHTRTTTSREMEVEAAGRSPKLTWNGSAKWTVPVERLAAPCCAPNPVPHAVEAFVIRAP
jgi:hypothetical protein